MSEQFETLEQKASYGIGLQMGGQFANKPFEGFCVDSIKVGFADALQEIAPQVDPEAINEAFQIIQGRIQEAEAENAKAMTVDGQAFLDNNATRDEVTVTDSGLQFEILVAGDGEKPTAASTVRTHYHGSLIDGTVFDSSVDRGQPAEFPVGGVIAGWTEALQMMPVGSKWRLTIPYNLAYGEKGAGGAIGPYATLVFDVELLEILA